MPTNHSSSSINGRHRVVITGVGIASAIGMDESSAWDCLMAGKSGIGPFRIFDAREHNVQIGAEIESALINEKLARLKRRPVDRAVDLAVVTSHDALLEAGLVEEGPPFALQDIAVVFGTGEGTANSHNAVMEVLYDKGPKGIRPTSVPRCMYNAISAGLSIQFKLTGPNYVVVSACTSGTNAIGAAYRMIRDGYEHTVLCGGTDSFFTPFFYGVWNNIPALSKIEDPSRACRPFAADRAGTVLGEGAGALILESLESARERGAAIRGEILGYGESSDALHITAPNPDGQVKAMKRALEEAGVRPEQLSLINAHGTATQSNDESESKSIRRVLGEATPEVPVVANKSYFGHTLGASGALEIITTLLALEKGVAPPNLNLENPDPACDIRLVGAEPLNLKPGPAMKNSFGFGGGNGVLVITALQQ